MHLPLNKMRNRSIGNEGSALCSATHMRRNVTNGTASSQNSSINLKQGMIKKRDSKPLVQSEQKMYEFESINVGTRKLRQIPSYEQILREREKRERETNRKDISAK